MTTRTIVLAMVCTPLIAFGFSMTALGKPKCTPSAVTEYKWIKLKDGTVACYAMSYTIDETCKRIYAFPKPAAPERCGS